MATKKLELLTTEKCIKYVQVLEITNDELVKLLHQAKDLLSKKEISKNYFNELQSNLQKKFLNNDKVVRDIESVVFDRMEKDLGRGITLPTDFARIIETIEQEKKRCQKSNVIEKPKLVVK